MANHSILLELDAETNDRVQRLASAQQKAPHVVLRDALTQYVERAEKREQLQREIGAAWTHYQSTGLHLTDDEADEWLSKLEAGEIIAPPSCHA